MASSTISGTITIGIEFGSGTYASPMTVTSTGVVTNSDGTTSGTAIYAAGTYGSATLVNQGTVGVSGTLEALTGVDFEGGGYVNNNGLIRGDSSAIRVLGAATIVNSGDVVAGTGNGIQVFQGAATITNTGTITRTSNSTAYAIAVYDFPAHITNGAGGFVGSLTFQTKGVGLDAGGTLDNAGTIAGFFGAITFGGTVDNRLILRPGSYLYGTVSGSTEVGATNTLELGTGTGTGTVSGVGTSIVNFDTITVDAGASWTMTGAGLIDLGMTLTNLGTLTQAGALEMENAGSPRLINSGSLFNTGTIFGGAGVTLTSGAYLSNAATGTITTSYSAGSAVYSTAAATVANSGSIGGGTAPGGQGVYLTGGGSVTNTASGRISGDIGVYIAGAAGTVTNSGTIDGDVIGVYLPFGGGVTNTAGLIDGSYGVAVGAGGTGVVMNAGTIVGSVFAGVALMASGTLINAGTIIGSGGTAVSFGGSGSNLLGLQAGFTLVGDVAGGASASDTLALLGSVGAPVTVDYNGLGLTSFEHILFGSGNYATLQVSNTSGTLGPMISGFDATTESIDLTAIGTNGTITNFDTANDRITVTGSLGSVTLQFDAIDGMNFTAQSDGVGGTELIACFRRGTLIRTPAVEAAVEDLAIGDRVVTASGAARPIKWIGRRAYDARFVAGNRGVLPIRIEAGALAEGVPARDLWVSPEHALVIDGLFLPARLLVNGATIRQIDAGGRLEYFHIELDSPDVIFAEGATAETFADFGGRAVFHNSAEFARLYPDAAPADWDAYAALLGRGMTGLPVLRAGLLARAEALGRVSRDPDLHLIVDGAVTRAESADGRVYRFVLPAAAGSIAIASRSTVPAETEAASLDPRRLGVPLERVALCGAGLRIEIGQDCAALCDGFHGAEGSHRWSDGHGLLPPALLACFAGEMSIEVQIGATELHYPLHPARRCASPAAASRTDPGERRSRRSRPGGDGLIASRTARASRPS